MFDTSQLVFHFKSFSDTRGTLVVGERPATLPFDVLRFFVIGDVPVEGSRGGHAHRALHQFLVATNGRVRVDLTDGEDSASVLLDSPGVGLWVPPLVWATEHYLDAGSTLLVLASDPFDADDYIDTVDEVRQLRGVGDA